MDTQENNKHEHSEGVMKFVNWTSPPPPAVAYIKPSYFAANLAKPPFKSNLLRWLQTMFPVESIAKNAIRYGVGESKDGGVCWPFIDLQLRVNEITTEYHRTDGRRLEWKGRPMHAGLRIKGVLPRWSRPGRCLFGEHLLKEPDARKTVCIVESARAAFIMAMASPRNVWIATGGRDGIYLLGNVARQLKAYKKVIIYPNAGKYVEWMMKPKVMGIPNAVVSRCCEGKQFDTDLADIYAERKQEPF